MLCKLEGQEDYMEYSKVKESDLRKITEIKMTGFVRFDQRGVAANIGVKAVQWKKLTSLNKISVVDSYFDGFTPENVFGNQGSSGELPSLKYIEFKNSIIDVGSLNYLLKCSKNLQEIKRDNATKYDEDESVAFLTGFDPDQVAALERKITSINENSGTTTIPDHETGSNEDEYEDDFDDVYSDSSSDSSKLEIKVTSNIAKSFDSLSRSTDTELERELDDVSSQSTDNQSEKDIDWDVPGSDENSEEDFTVGKKYDLRPEDLAEPITRSRARTSDLITINYWIQDNPTLSFECTGTEFNAMSEDAKAKIVGMSIDGARKSIPNNILFAGCTGLKTLHIADAELLGTSSDYSSRDADTPTFPLRMGEDPIFPSLESLTIERCSLDDNGLQNFINNGRKTIVVSLTDIAKSEDKIFLPENFSKLVEDYQEKYRFADFSSITIATKPFVSETDIDQVYDYESTASLDNKSKVRANNGLRSSVASTEPRGVKLPGRQGPNMANRQSRRIVESVPLESPVGMIIMCKLKGDEEDIPTDYSALTSNDLDQIEEMFITGSGNEDTNILTDFSWEGLTGLKKLTVYNACIAVFEQDERLIDLPPNLEELHIAKNCAVNYDGLELFALQTYLTTLDLETGFQRATKEENYIQSENFRGADAMDELKKINSLINRTNAPQPIDDTIYDEEFETDSVEDKTATRIPLVISCKLEGDNPFLDRRDYTKLTDSQKKKIISLSITGTGEPEDCSIVGAIDWSQLKQLRFLEIANATFDPYFPMRDSDAALLPNIETVEFTNCGLDTQALTQFVAISGNKIKPFTIIDSFDAEDERKIKFNDEDIQMINALITEHIAHTETAEEDDEVDLYSNPDDLSDTKKGKSIAGDDDMIEQPESVTILCRLIGDDEDVFRNYSSLTADQVRKVDEMKVIGSGTNTNLISAGINWSGLNNLTKLTVSNASIAEFKRVVGDKEPFFPKLGELNFADNCAVNCAGLEHFSSLAPNLEEIVFGRAQWAASKGRDGNIIVKPFDLSDLSAQIERQAISRLSRKIGGFDPKPITAPFIFCKLEGQVDDYWLRFDELSPEQKGNITDLHIRGFYPWQNIISSIDWENLEKLKDLTIENAMVEGNLPETTKDNLFPALEKITFGDNCTVDVNTLKDFNSHANDLQFVEYKGKDMRVQSEITTILKRNAKYRALREDVEDKDSKPSTAPATQRSIYCWLNGDSPNHKRYYDFLSDEEKKNIRTMFIFGEIEGYDVVADKSIEWSKFSGLEELRIIDASLTGELKAEIDDEFFPNLVTLQLYNCTANVDALDSFRRLAGANFHDVRWDNSHINDSKTKTVQDLITQLEFENNKRQRVLGEAFSALKPEKTRITCRLQGADPDDDWGNYNELSATEKNRVEYLSIMGTDRTKEVDIDWTQLPNLQVLHIENAKVPPLRLEDALDTDELFPNMRLISLVNCDIDIGTIQLLSQESGDLSNFRMENLRMPNGKEFSSADQNTIKGFAKGHRSNVAKEHGMANLYSNVQRKFKQSMRELDRPQTNMAYNSNTMFGNRSKRMGALSSSADAHRDSKKTEIPITSTGNVDPRRRKHISPMMRSTQRYRSMSVDSIYHSPEQEKPRSLTMIMQDIRAELNELEKKHESIENYSLEKNTAEQVVHLNYAAEDEEPVRILDAKSDTVTVYKSWSTQVDPGNKDITRKEKAVLVLKSLGIPPCPPDIEISKTKSPLAAEVRKQFIRFQKEEALQKTSGMESGDEDVMRVSVKGRN